MRVWIINLFFSSQLICNGSLVLYGEIGPVSMHTGLTQVHDQSIRFLLESLAKWLFDLPSLNLSAPCVSESFELRWSPAS